MRLAVIGGSFNPVHNGHVALAFAVRRRLGYDRVLFVPANLPPHKELASGATGADRLAMLALAVEAANLEAGEDFLAVDPCEIRRGGLSYTIETIGELEARYGARLEGKIGLVMGQDLVAGFSSWRRADELAQRTDIILARRGEGTDPFPWRHVELENALLPASSSAIREAIKAGKPWRSLVPEAVSRYIGEHTLYES